MDKSDVASSPGFLSNGGEVGALMRAHDWSTSPLGPPDTWPQSLRSVVGLMLNSRFSMFVAWGPELGFLYNDSYAEILGDKHPFALGRRFQDIWAEIWGDIYPIIVQALDGKATYFENLPLTLNRKGYYEQAWFTFSYSPVRDESGAVAGMYCAVTETTQQVLAERHRENENQRLHRLFEQAPGLMAVFRDSDHVFEIANAVYRQLAGNRKLIGKPVREALPELEGQGFFELMDRVFTTGEPVKGRAVSVKLLRENGELEELFVDFLYQPIRNAFGKVTGIFVEGADVTEAITATAALRESERRMRQLANTIPQLAWMADADGWVHWYNDRWYEYTGTTFEQVQGWGWECVQDPEVLPEAMRTWKEALSAGNATQMAFPLRGADGRYRQFLTTVAPLRDASGQIVQWFGTNTDVTELEEAKNELRAANRRKDEFLAMLAHELRNPLAPISAAAELLKLTSIEGDRMREMSDIIARQVNHMSELVDDMIDVSRVTRGLVMLQKEKIDSKGVVADAVEQVRSLIESKHQRLTIRMPPEPPILKGDRTRLIQVFTNLLNNAAKYTPEHGHIALQVDVQPDCVEVRVQDTGIGIPAELLPHVFELFTQAERASDRSQGGLGIGLTLVKSLVDLHGGSVSVQSEGAGRGSTFIVQLPRVTETKEQEAQEPKHNKADMPSSINPLRVMVVDDNVDAAKTLSLLLETVGHKVAVEYSAEPALERARHLAPHILFLDIGLPDMDGYELVRNLRAIPETAQSMLVAVTGYDQPQDKERARQAGFDHHLVKPVKLAAILGLVADFENSRRQ